MPSGKLIVGGAGAATVLGIRVARSLHGRWRLLPEPQRRAIELLAQDLRTKALDLRGASDPRRAEEELRASNEGFATALVETAEADPEVGEREVRELRGELQRELARLASGDVAAARGPAKRRPAAGERRR